MKVRRIIGILFSLIVLMELLPIGQAVYAEDKQLKNVSISSEGVLSWDPFYGAGGYRLIYAARQWSTDKTYVDLSELGDLFGLENGLKHVTVVALDQLMSPNHEISETWSGTYVYDGCLGKLASPVASWDGYVAKWTAVEHAEKYDFKLYNESDKVILEQTGITDNEINLSVFTGLVKGKQYYFTVVARGTKYQDSSPGKSDPIEGWLEQGTLIGMDFEGDFLYWNHYEGAGGYRVVLGGKVWHINDNFINIRALSGQFGLSYGAQTVTVVALDRIMNPNHEISKVWTGTYDFQPAPLTGIVRIQGTVKHFGDILELEYAGIVADVPASNLHYEWQISDNKTSWKNIVGVTDAALDTSILSDEAMIYVRVRVTADGYEDALYSDIRAINPASVTETITGTVTIIQGSIYETHFVIGSTITATAKNTLGNEMTMDGLMYRWQRRKDESSEWEYIDGATGKTYSPTNDDERYFLRAEVTYTQMLGELYSESKQVDWRKTYHTVSFDLQGHGSEPIPDKSIKRGSTVMKPYPQPSDKEWTFAGWFNDAACKYEYDFDTPVTGNFTLHAKWIKPESTDALYVVTAGSLNVRENAGDSYNRIGGLDFGDVVQAKAAFGDWVKIEFEGKEGWVNRDFLALTYSKETAIKPTEYTVTASALNVRKDISTSSDRIGGLKSGDVILATGKRTDGEGYVWFVLDYVGEDGVHQLGYVLEKFTEGKEAKEDVAVASIEFPEFPEIPDEIDQHSALPVIANEDQVKITEDNINVNDDGDLTVTVFPDDGNNFKSITKDTVLLPSGSGYAVKTVALNTDGSVTITLGKEVATVSYTVTDGADGNWKKGSSEDYTITVKRSEDDGSCFAHYKETQIDGKTISVSARSGSTVITIGSEILEKLSAGTHTVTVVFDDGEAETGLTIDDKTERENPMTGVNGQFWLYTGLLVVSLLSYGAVLYHRRNMLG